MINKELDNSTNMKKKKNNIIMKYYNFNFTTYTFIRFGFYSLCNLMVYDKMKSSFISK